MGDASLVQSGDSATGHAVVLGVDDVEGLAGVDGSLGDGLGLSLVPGRGLLRDEMPGVRLGGDLLVQGLGTADLRVGTHDALNVHDVVLLKALALQPFHGGDALVAHVGNDGGLVQALIAVDHAVEQEDDDAVLLRGGQHVVPAGGLGGGDQQVLNAFGDELLSGVELLVVLQAVEGLGVIAVLGGEDLFKVLNVGLTIAGLRRRIVHDADADKLAFGGSERRAEQQSADHEQREYLFHVTSLLVYLERKRVLSHQAPAGPLPGRPDGRWPLRAFTCISSRIWVFFSMQYFLKFVHSLPHR